MNGVQVVSSVTSVASAANMESRVIVMEPKLDDMEKIIVASIQSILQNLFEQKQTKESPWRQNSWGVE